MHLPWFAPAVFSGFYVGLVAVPAAAQWKVSSTKDPITDEVTTAFMVTSAQPVRDAAGIPRPVQLVIRCQDQRFTDIYVSTNTYVGDGVRVQYRVNGDRVFEEEWTGGRAQDALFYNPSTPELLWLQAIVFTRSREVIFRWFPPREDARTATFRTTGFQALPQSSLAACGEDRATRDRAAVDGRRRDSLKAERDRIIQRLESDNAGLPWAGRRGGGTYWSNVESCVDYKLFRRSTELVYFRSEEDALTLGRRRSTETGC